jgi:hypothetical protein
MVALGNIRHPSATAALPPMRFLAPSLLALALAALAVPSAVRAQASPTVDIGGVPIEIDNFVVGHRVPLNGAGVRVDGDTKLYVAALYISKKSRSLIEVAGAPGPKRLHVHMLREIEGKSLGAALSQGMNSNLSAREVSACLPGVLKMSELFATKKKLNAGESFTLDSVPGQGTVVRINNEKAATIDAKEFFGCMLQVYIGERPADAALKAALLAGKR